MDVLVVFFVFKMVSIDGKIVGFSFVSSYTIKIVLNERTDMSYLIESSERSRNGNLDFSL